MFFSASLFAAAGAGSGNGARSFIAGPTYLALVEAVGSLRERRVMELLCAAERLSSPAPDLFSFWDFCEAVRLVGPRSEPLDLRRSCLGLSSPVAVGAGGNASSASLGPFVSASSFP